MQFGSPLSASGKCVAAMDYVAQPFQKSPLSLLQRNLPCLPAFLPLPRLRMCKHVYILREGREGGEEGGVGGGGRVGRKAFCARINRDVHAGICGLIYQLKRSDYFRGFDNLRDEIKHRDGSRGRSV